MRRLGGLRETSRECGEVERDLARRQEELNETSRGTSRGFVSVD